MNQNIVPITSNKINQTTKSMTHHALSGFAWTFSGTGVQVGLEMLVLVILARILTPKDFGIVSAAMVVVRLSEIFTQIGIGPAIVQRRTLDTIHLRTGFTISCISGLFLTGLISLFAPKISTFFQLNELIPVIQLISFGFLFQGMSLVAESLLQRELQFRWLSVIRSSCYAVYGIVGISLAFLEFGV